MPIDWQAVACAIGARPSATLDTCFASEPLIEVTSTMTKHYQLLTSEADYRQACDTVLRLAQREILIFDRDLAALRLEDTERLSALADFLQAAPLRRVRMVLHEPERLECNAPKLMRLILRFSHVIAIRRSPDNLRHLADTHLLADQCLGLRRFHVDQPRSALVLDDPLDIQPWWQRFEELWDLSQPCVSINTTGL